MDLSTVLFFFYHIVFLLGVRGITGHLRDGWPSTRLLLMPMAFFPLIGASAQVNHQTLRGTVLDADSHQPVFSASIAILGSEPALTATTDEEGHFTISDVPTGRVTLRVRAMGFEEQTLSNLLLVSGKELIVNVLLQGAIKEIDEVTVTADKRKGELRNDMATLSARKISVEETPRIAGGINDPARMVSTFPGVAGDPAGDNTIVVRGNSPKGVLWRLEGMEIPNPNHFAQEGSTGGPINVLNSDMIDDSEFYTGAFAPEYGNATSAVFDMRLRNGNNSKREHTLKVGVLGTDFTTEGPLPGSRGGSYLANYRYSSLALLDRAGIVDYGGVPDYTDGSFKVNVPTKAGTFAVWGLGGISHIEQKDLSGDTLFSQGDYRSRMGVAGITHTRTLGERSYVQSGFTLSGNSSGAKYSETPSVDELELEPRHNSELNKWTMRFSSTLNNKLSAKHKLRSGIIVSVDRFRMSSSSWDADVDRMVNELNTTGAATTVQAFSSWKWRWNQRWTMTSGFHLLHFALNKSTSIEPRVGLRYQWKPDQAFTFGAGLHSRTEPVMTYLAQAVDPNGAVYQPNLGLGLSRALHFVAGFERMLAPDLQLKGEVYYQHLFGMPVENSPTSSYSLANSVDWFSNRSLVNDGVGRNCGMELALEKFLSRSYHFMITGSLSDARYKAEDGVWHNSRFNIGTVANVLGGKEWNVGKDRTIMTGVRYSVIGGQYRTPIDLPASIAAGQEVGKGEVWSEKGDAVQKLDVVLSYRLGRKKVSHEFKLDVQNVLNARTAVYRYFDRRTGTIKDVPQLTMLPVFQYTLRF